jgi:hypothetical protein
MDQQAAGRTIIGEVGKEMAASELQKAVLDFRGNDAMDLELYSFRGEYAVKGDDIVFHFFLPQRAVDQCRLEDQSPSRETLRARQAWQSYWLNRFKDKLLLVLVEHFGCGAPRLQAAYTEEAASWWVKAQGFGTSSDPELLVRRFFEKLDDALKAKGSS